MVLSNIIMLMYNPIPELRYKTIFKYWPFQTWVKNLTYTVNPWVSAASISCPLVPQPWVNAHRSRWALQASRMSNFPGLGTLVMLLVAELVTASSNNWNVAVGRQTPNRKTHVLRVQGVVLGIGNTNCKNKNKKNSHNSIISQLLDGESNLCSRTAYGEWTHFDTCHHHTFSKSDYSEMLLECEYYARNWRTIISHSRYAKVQDH